MTVFLGLSPLDNRPCFCHNMPHALECFGNPGLWQASNNLQPQDAKTLTSLMQDKIFEGGIGEACHHQVPRVCRSQKGGKENHTNRMRL